jgi:hypothetical protein
MTDVQKPKMGGGDEPVMEFSKQELDGLIVLTYVGTRLAEKFEQNPNAAVPADSRARVWAAIQTKRAEIEREERMEKRRLRRTRVLRYVALFFIAFLLVNLLLATTVEAYRETLIRIFTRNGEHAIEVHFENNSDAEPIDPSVLVYEPTYLPEGYKLQRIISKATKTTVYYANRESTLEFVQGSTGMGFSVDNEHGESGSVAVSLYEGVYVKINNDIVLVWSNGESSFLLQGELSLNELVEIAESVEKR